MAQRSLQDDYSRPVRCRLYLDESGDHNVKRLDEPARRYLALVGVWFMQRPDYTAFADALEAFKRSVFGPRPDEPVILHRADMVGRLGPFVILHNPVERDRFNSGLLKLVVDAPFMLVCAVIDKLEYQTRYSTPLHSYHVCLAEMLDRYAQWLEDHGAVGDVMVEARGKAEDRSLLVAYQQIYGTGRLAFDRARNRQVLTSKELKFRDKDANIAGLQLADILAHPVKQWVLVQRGRIVDPGETFGRRLVRAAEGKFLRDERTGKLDGNGVIWLPK